MKKKLSVLLILCLSFAITACTPKEKPKQVEEPAKQEVTKEVPVQAEVKKEEPKKEETKKEEIKKEEPKKVNKDELKKHIDLIVPKDLKGKSYSVDILTPTKNEDKGYIVSIQVDNKKFLDEASCKEYAKEFLSKLYDIEGVQSVDMNFIADMKLLYGFRIDDFLKVSNKDIILENVEFEKFQ